MMGKVGPDWRKQTLRAEGSRNAQRRWSDGCRRYACTDGLEVGVSREVMQIKKYCQQETVKRNGVLRIWWTMTQVRTYAVLV